MWATEELADSGGCGKDGGDVDNHYDDAYNRVGGDCGDYGDDYSDDDDSDNDDVNTGGDDNGDISTIPFKLCRYTRRGID